MSSGIYKITNKVNGKLYIGSATHFSQRWGMHLHMLRKGNHHSVLLQRSFNKYGEQSFSFEKILICPKESLLIHEQQALDEMQSYDPLIGYNICKIAGSSAGCKMSEKTLAIQRKRMMGNTYTLGFKHTEEAKRGMSKTRMGNKFSVGKKNWLGKKHTEETKARLSEVAKNRPPRSEESKAKTSQSLKDAYKANPRITKHIVSEETKKKMSLARLGKSTAKKGTKQPPHSEETKRKMSEARKLWHARKKIEGQTK